MNWFEKWCADNTTKGKLTRTIAQGIIGVVVANIDIIIGSFTISEVWKPIIVMIVMAVLSPIQSAIGQKEVKI